MRALLALLLLLLAVPAQAAVCSDDSTRRNDLDQCPARLFNPNVTAITSTSASINGENDAQGIGSSRTVFLTTALYPPGCTAANVSGLTEGTPEYNSAIMQCLRLDLFKAGIGASVPVEVDQLVYAGPYSRVVSGLAPATTYRGFSVATGPVGCDTFPNHTQNCNTTVSTSVFQKVVFTTLAGGGEEFVADGGAAAVFLRSDGNNLLDGTSHANGWDSLSKVECGLPSGTNVALFNASTWVGERLTICWPGILTDYNIIGSYRLNGDGTPIWTVDTIEGPAAEDEKAKLWGGLNQGCIDARSCTYPSSGFPVDGMFSIYDALLTIPATGDFTKLQALDIGYTRYGTIAFGGSGIGSPGSLTNLIVEDVYLHHTGHGPAILFSDGAQKIVVRDTSGYYLSTCYMTRLSPKLSTDTSTCEAGQSPNWPGAFIQITRSRNAQALIERTDYRRAFGEGIGWYNNNSTMASVVRNNKGMNTWSDLIFMDGTGQVVIEGNILVGGNGQMDSTVTGSGAFSCIHSGTENGAFENATNIVIRNNLCVGSGWGTHVDMFPSAIAAGDQSGVKIYGNTLVANETIVVNTGLPLANTTEFDVTNNIAWSGLGANECGDGNNVGNFLDNHWTSTPSDVDCRGTGDTTGVPGLTLATLAEWTALREQSGATPVWPTWAQATPTGGGAVDQTGTAQTSAILDIANFSWAWANMEDAGGTLTESEWECANCVDALGATRANPPSKGAVE